MRTGIEILVDTQVDLVRGRRIGLFTNQSGVLPSLESDLSALQRCGASVVALFGGEHGLRGDAEAGQDLEPYVHPTLGIPVYDLFTHADGVLKPTREALQTIDCLLFDIQEIPVRYYTYSWSLIGCLEACADAGTELIVCDRPNPLGWPGCEGNVSSLPLGKTFEGRYVLPARYDLTIGELAALLNSQLVRKAPLRVMRLEGWHHGLWFDETRLPWVLPSPAIPTLETAIVYTGTCLIEGTNVSEGRGTTRPFEIVGAPWIRGEELAQRLNSLALPGVRFREATFLPGFSKYAGRSCGGIQIHVIDRDNFRPFRTGVEVVRGIRELYPDQFNWFTYEGPSPRRGSNRFDYLVGDGRLRAAIEGHEELEALLHALDVEAREFERMRERCLLYSTV